MFTSFFLMIICLLGLLLAGGLIVGIFVVMQSGRSDVMSDARQDWIERRSEKDQGGW